MTTTAAAIAPRDAFSFFTSTRARTETLVAPLVPEDLMLQSMEDASPAKWISRTRHGSSKSSS